MSRLLRSALAALTLLALLVGVPVALVGLVGLPSLSSLPPLGDLSGALQRTPSTDLLVAALALVLWLAWLRLAFGVAAELVAAVRPGRRRRPAASAAPTRRVAAFLVSALLGVGPSALAHLPAAAAATAAPAVSPTEVTSVGPAVAPPDQLRTAASASTWQVRPGDSLWRIAEDALGDGTRWREVHEANLGRNVADGVRYHDGSVLQPGWTLVLPASTPPVAAGPTVLVRPGDSLSAIAARTLGDADRWPELFAANRGQRFDGRTFDDPSLLVPGWQLVLPSVAGVEELQPVTAPAVASPGDARPTVPATDAPLEDPAAAVSLPTPATVAVEAAPTDIPSPVETDEPCAAPAAAAATTTVTQDPADDASNASASREGSTRHLLPVGGALLATGIAGLVVARRRAALRSAGRDASPRLPSPVAQAVEQAAVAQADPLGVARLDLALRALVAATDGAARPQWIRREPDGTLVVGLAQPVPAPAPWQERPDGTLLLASTTPTSALVADARAAGSPCPALVELGRADDGSSLGVDLEAIGLLSLDGPPAATQRLVRALLATLATSPLADRVQVVTTSEVPALGDRVVHVDDVDAGVDAALALAQPVADALAAGPHRSAAALRALDPAEAWDTAVLLVVDGGADLPAEVRAPAPGRGLGVVATAPVSGGWRLRARTDARWELEPLGLVLRPAGLAARELDAIATLLLEAQHPVVEPSVATPVAAEVARWVTSAPVVAPPPAPARSPWAPPAVEAPELPFEEADPDLVAEVEDAGQWAFLVRVLGRPEVVDGDLAPVRFEKAKSAELVAWLAEHAETATRSGARAALWEADVRDATFANVVSEARRALARAVAPPPGEEWIGRGQGERIPLHPGVRSDVEVIRRTARACRDLPDHVAVPALRRVLALVRDVPYAGSGFLWPDADGRATVAIVVATSAAADLASRLLDAGDVDGAFWATEQGLKVLPGHEELVCLRMEAHARLGDLVGVRAEYASYERAVLSDPWGDGTIATKVSSTRSRLLSAHRAPEPVGASA